MSQEDAGDGRMTADGIVLCVGVSPEAYRKLKMRAKAERCSPGTVVSAVLDEALLDPPWLGSPWQDEAETEAPEEWP